MLRVGLSPSGAGVVFSGEDDEEEDTDSDADAPGGGAATTRAAAAAAGAGAGAGGAAQDPAAAAAAAVIARTKSGKAHQGKQLMHSGLSAVLNPVLEKLAARVEELQTSQLVRARRGDRTSACRGETDEVVFALLQALIEATVAENEKLAELPEMQDIQEVMSQLPSYQVEIYNHTSQVTNGARADSNCPLNARQAKLVRIRKVMAGTTAQVLTTYVANNNLCVRVTLTACTCCMGLAVAACRLLPSPRQSTACTSVFSKAPRRLQPQPRVRLL